MECYYCGKVFLIDVVVFKDNQSVNKHGRVTYTIQEWLADQ